MYPLHIHIIGSGKLGRSLSQKLCENNTAHTLHNRNHPSSLTGLIYLCVPENAIPNVAKSLTISNGGLLLHASGSLGLEALHPHVHNIGCLHPIQSFPGPEVAIPSNIPATFQCHENDKDRLWPIIQWFAAQVDFELFDYSGSRLAYHTAAVVSGNFATILLHQAAHLLVREGMTLEDACRLLQPLAMDSIANAHRGTLHDVLTGPIARRQVDLLMQQHDNLSFNPTLQALYQLMVKLGSETH